MLLAQGQVPEASAHLRTAMRIKPNDDRVRFNYANLQQASGRTDEAIAELRRAVRLNPDNADAHFNLAVLLGPRNQLDEAIAHLRRVIEINPGMLTRIAISPSDSACRVNSRKRSATTGRVSVSSPARPRHGIT